MMGRATKRYAPAKSGRFRRFVSGVAAASLAVASLVGLNIVTAAEPALAAPGDPFSPAAPTVFVAQSAAGGTTGLFRAETTGSGDFAFTPEGNALTAGTYNAISFNSANNYIYGASLTAIGSIPANALVRVGESGVVTRVGTMTFPAIQQVGAFNPANGRLYTHVGTNPNTPFNVVNVTTGTIVQTITPSITNFVIADMEYADGYFWAIDYAAAQPAGTILRINPANGVINRYPGVLNTGTNTGAWGAAWRFGNGNLGFSNNSSGDILQVRITNPTAATPTFTSYALVDGPSSSGNDGTAIPGLPADLAITKTGPATFKSGNRISYNITVTNNGAGVSSGWTMTDVLPAGLSNPSVVGNVSSSISGSTVTVNGARMAVGQSVTFTIEADTNVNPPACIVNTATVLGNEADPVAGNNESSATSCATQLRVTKTSNATANSRPGDVITYTVRATNTGAGPFTAANPAVVFDDMTRMLDDANYNNNASASRPGTLAYTSPRISWSGALGVGEFVDITYTATLKTGGDGNVDNVAWVPNNPAVTTPPTCRPATGGVDNATGQPCALVEYDLPRLTVTKTVNRTDLPAVGEQATFSIVVRNAGPGVYSAAAPATMTDDLSDVLDDSTINAGSITSTAGTATVSGNTLSWSGPLAAGAQATITYTVTYTGDGDNVLNNQACVPTDQTLPGASSCATVRVPAADLSQWKSATPSETPTVAGSTITYTLFFRNSGTGPATVNAVDHLDFVLDDAEVTEEPTSADGLSAVRSGDEITVTGSVPAGETYTVEYTVTVLPDDERGDSIATNFLLPPGGTPPSDGVCVPADPAFPNCTSTPITGIAYTKTVEASETPTVSGTELTYTITATNMGATPVDVERDDDLSDVLDDATLTGGPASDLASVTVTGPTADILEIRGTLQPGDVAEITYTVTVNDFADRGNNSANNFLVPPGTPPAGPCDPATEQCTTTPIQGFTVAKTSDSTTTTPGGVVEYSVTVTNTGGVAFTAANPASFSDNLSGVLDDATYNGDATNGATVTGNTLAWSGALAVGGSVTITYSVTVDDPTEGDSLLANAVVPTTPGGECDPDAECVTETPISSYTVSKTADAASVQPGDVLTYSVVVTNTGQVDYTAANPATFDDDLSGVLDDATYNGDATGGATVTGDTLTWSGALAVGDSVTVTYSVTVNDPLSGDQLLANAVVPTAPGGSCDPDGECVTETPVSSYTVSKTTNVSSVQAGDTVTYTVVVTNTSDVDYTVTDPATFDDDLTGVLDDATYNGDVSVGGSVTGNTLSWAGPLAAGASVAVTYSVTVNDPLSGDQNLANAVVPTAPGGSCDPAAECVTETPVASYTVAKTSDSATTTPGGTVEYTVTVTNTGTVDYTVANPASFEDDLSGVLDDAVYNGDATNGATVTGSTLSWSGALAAGDSITVTYSVTVDDPTTGDSNLANSVVPTGPGGSCDPAGECVTETPVSSYTVSKTADVASVQAGGVVTYTVTVTNTGQVDYTAANPATFDDDLSGVLDDATYNGDATGGAAVTGDTLTWSGSLAAGASTTVTYSVTVNDPLSGDQNLANAVVPTGPGGSCDPDEECVTETPVASYTVDKAASATSARPGDTITYTVTVTNTGDVDYTAAAPASFEDDLSGVLDDAVYNGDATNGATVTGDTLAWSGALTAGQTITITYSVTVDDPITGDFVLANTVTPTGPGGECDTVCETTTPVASYRVTKSTTATEVVPGDVVAYTITVENTGQVAYTAADPASFTDDLSAVLDDAVYNGDGASTTGSGVTYTAPELAWSDALAIGETVTITYSVTVNDPATGDRVLDNTVVTPPGSGANCPAGSTDPACTVTIPNASYTVSKTSDSSSVQAGGVVTYTVTVTNTGAVDYTAANPATFDDDLSGVLDDATYNGDVSTGGSVTGDTLSWSGALAVGASTTVTYSVTVNDPLTGDQNLANAVVPTAPGGECDPAGECVTETPVASYTVSKTSDSATVTPGGVVTYTVTVTNTGTVDYTVANPASFEDDLSGVLDDAVYNGDATNGATVTGNTLSWSGALAAGDSVTVTYSVTVDDPTTGDSNLANSVVPTGPGGSCDPAGECVTETPVSSYTVSKTADVASVQAGGVVTYTVTVTNTGQVDYTAANPATFDDDLSGVLDDATYNDDVSTGGSVTGNTLTWTGALAAGDSVTVTYSVTVNDPLSGDQNLANAVVPTSPGGSCDPDEECVTETPVASYTVEKASDVTSVQAGGVVTYSVTVTNTGAVDYTTAAPASFDDDLSGVLDDATYNGDISVGGSVTGNTLSWAGPLAAGASITVTYSVTVNDPLTGDQNLANAVVPTGPGGTCEPGECVTETPVASYTVSKTSDTATVTPGGVVTYTVTVTNTGDVDYTAAEPASFEDDLSGVLDDAVYNGDATNGATVTGSTLSWSGALAAGDSITVTYSVTVDDPTTGDSNLANSVVPTGPGGECDPAGECVTETPVSSYTVSKTADVASVQPGDVVTYTVTVTNTGQVDYTAANPATFDDDLSGVLDDATYNNDATNGATVTGSTLSWSGAIAAGDSLTVTYSVTVDDPITGDQNLANAVVPTGPGGSCDPDEECTTETPVSSYTVSKTSDSTTVTPGGVVTYTITVTNTGDVDYTAANPASFEDDLSGVLDDAVYNDDATNGATVTGNTLSWSGALAAGQMITITYSVTVDDPTEGDSNLANAVVPTGPGGECDPAAECVTETPVSSYTVSKVADAASVQAGGVVTYSVTVTNTGQVDYTAAAPASFDDDLSGVLDDATYNNDATSGATVAGSTLSWSGALAVGDSVTVTYSVTVNDPLSGDQNLANAVVPTAPGGSCDPDEECTTETPVASYTVSKTSDASATTPGGVVTYTVTVTNTGTVDYTAAAPASFEDDLSGVLDDATYNDDATNGATVAGSTLSWSGALAAGDSIEITYSVTVDDPTTGDSNLANSVVPTGPGGECDPAAECVTETPVSSYSVEKTSDVSSVQAGGVVTYTVVVTNTGQVDYTVGAPASFEDDLSGVLDDATYNADATNGATVSGSTLSWSGPLAVGQSLAITYSVTVNDPISGDQNLANAVIPTAPGGSCAEDAECVTETPVASYTVAKSSDAATVLPGGVVTYTVTVTNTGEVDYTAAEPASFEDDLSGVLDDAVYNDDATNGATVTGSTLSWSGALAAGDSIEITYSVTVDDPTTGDSNLANVVVPTGPGGECEPGECTTETLVSSYTVEKTADVASVQAGGVVTYSVVVTNTGQVDYTAADPATFDDDLTGVLDDATYNGEVSTGGSVSGNTLTWTGALAVGDSVTVTYSVTVNDPISGDQNLANAVVPTAPGGSCAVDAECTTETPVASYTVTKEADAASARPGDTITYTVTVVNTGDVAYTDAEPASFDDDLSGVLDDAAYNDDATNGATVAGSTLSWSGALAIGETITVTYSVTVDEPVTGDFILANGVAPTGPGGSCEGVCETTTPVASYRVTKTTPTTEVVPGDEIEYTVTVENTGQVDYTTADPASFSDDLSAVLDDATYNGDGTSTSGSGVTYGAPTLAWSGALAIGETVTITYSVTVNSPATGDRLLSNTVVTPPGSGANCPEGSTDPACNADVPGKSFSLVKTASPGVVLPGEVVTYTVTVTNTGQVAYTDAEPASFSDDLSRVLDDAVYNDDVSVGGAVTGDTLTWSGPLEVGESQQITYTVTVNDPVTGDFTLRNVVAPTSPGGECAEGDCITDTPVSAYTVQKSSDVEDVVLGGVVTYSVTVTNTGQVDYTEDAPASLSDDLSAVLDDAEYNDDATNGATVSGTTLTWAGPLAVGESLTITYSVTVSNPASGDGVLRNTVTADGPGGGCSTEGGCVTETEIASYRVAKTVSSERATIGDKVTFTVTVTNTGQVAYTDERPASFTDDLSSVLSHATYNNDATSGAVYERPVLSWSGALDVGETVTVTYSATLQSVGEIRNVVVTPDGTGANCPTDSTDPDCETTTTIVPPGLAITGGSLWIGGGVAGAALLALGVWLVARRRRDSAAEAL